MAAEPLKCLFVSPVVPWPPDSGGRIRTWQLLRALRAQRDRAEVHLRVVQGEHGDTAGLRELESVCASVKAFARAPANAWTRLTRAKQERWFRSTSLTAALREETRGERYDVVHVDEMFVVRALPASMQAPLVVHHHKLDTRFSTLEPSANPLANAFDGFKLARLEDFAARRSCFHVLTSVEDERALKLRFPELATAVVENGFDPAAFFPQATKRERSELLFLGSLDYWPNVDGLTWFVREVLPRIAVARPDVRLQIVGRAPTSAAQALAAKNVSLVGAVPDVRPYLARASALVIPLRIGGGSRLKLVEAMATATPVVSTRIGAEGLGFQDPEHLWLADDADAFARSTLAALDDPRGAGARAGRGRAFALQHYAWDDLAGKLLAAWERAARS